MASNSSGAVFFLGTRAHYQVLQPPDTVSYDLKNGNESTETIYQNNASIKDVWLASRKDEEIQNSGNYLTGECGNWMSCGRNETNAMECNDNELKEAGFELGVGVTRRLKKNKKQFGSNEQILNGNEEAIEIDPTALNKLSDRNTQKPKSTSRPCASFRAFLASLKSKRKRKLSAEELNYVDNLKNILDMCTYKDSCRCLDCQSRYFECDESDGDLSDASGSECSTPERMLTRAAGRGRGGPVSPQEDDDDEDDDEEVFVDVAPSDNTSTDLLLDAPHQKMSVSSSESAVSDEAQDLMQLEMAAGTPIVLDYLLNHPITCTIQ